jgi:hypothetical protein
MAAFKWILTGVTCGSRVRDEFPFRRLQAFRTNHDHLRDGFGTSGTRSAPRSDEEVNGTDGNQDDPESQTGFLTKGTLPEAHHPSVIL